MSRCQACDEAWCWCRAARRTAERAPRPDETPEADASPEWTQPELPLDFSD